MTNYLTAGETAELMRSGKEYRRKVMSGPEMLTGREMARRVSDMCCADVDIEQIHEWGVTGGVIELRCGSMRRYPAWQLDAEIWDSVQDISSRTQMTGWALYGWMAEPLGGLDGGAPVDALRAGRTDRVLDLAEAAGAA